MRSTFGAVCVGVSVSIQGRPIPGAVILPGAFAADGVGLSGTRMSFVLYLLATWVERSVRCTRLLATLSKCHCDQPA